MDHQKQKKKTSSSSSRTGGGRGGGFGRSQKKRDHVTSTGGRPLTRSVAAKKPRVADGDGTQQQQQKQQQNTTKSSTVAAITPTSLSFRKSPLLSSTTRKQPPFQKHRDAVNNCSSSSATTADLLLTSPSSSLMLPPASINLPPTVPNLFAPPPVLPTHHYNNNYNYFTSTPCQCLGHQCSRGCISAEYNASYGWEQKTLLKAKEDMEYHEPTTTTTRESTTTATATTTTTTDDDDYDDPMEPLVCSGIVPSFEHRALKKAKRTKWFGPQSINWDLNEYMDRQTDLAPRMRCILIDWIVELTEEYNLSPTTFHLAVTLIDKSLACVPTSSADRDDDDHHHNHDNDDDDDDMMGFYVSRDMLQCLGCACTWIAAKMEEVKAPSVDDFVYISDNIYRREQILEMELDVCNVLKFRLQHVTPVHYAHEYLLASEAKKVPVVGCGGNNNNNSDESMMERRMFMPTGPAFHPILRHMVYYLLELSRIAYEFVATKPSLVAASAVFLARATLGIRESIELDPTTTTAISLGGGYWTETLEYYSGYSVKDMKDTVRVLLQYQQKAEESKLNSVFTKYSKAKFMHVSTKTVLTQEQLPF